MNAPARPRASARQGSPKYPAMREKIRRQITRGVFKRGARLPPEAALAARFKVNKLTVSRALQDLVQEGLVVQRRGDGSYVTDVQRPPLVPGRILRLGILWFFPLKNGSLGNDFTAAVTRGALAEWGVEEAEAGFTEPRAGQAAQAWWRQPKRGLTVACIGQDGKEHARHPALQEVRDGRFDGILTLGIIEEDWLAQLLDLSIPTVLVDFPGACFAARADQVFVDPQSGYRAAVRHLVARGLSRIHFLGLVHRIPAIRPTDSSSNEHATAHVKRIDPDSHLRLSAFRQEMDAQGLAVPESAVHFEHIGKLEGLAGHLTSLPEEQRPQAVVSHSAAMAEILIDQVEARGMHLAGAGAAERAYAGRALPVRIDGHEVGRVAADLLLARLQRPHRPFLSVGVRMVFEPPERAAGQGLEPGTARGTP